MIINLLKINNNHETENLYIIDSILCNLGACTGCDNDDDDSIAVPAALQEAFSSKYPNVKNVKWETKAGYYVADFYDGYEASAWFTTDGNWHMTETDIPYTALPDPVKSAFETSEYKTWKKDDVDDSNAKASKQSTSSKWKTRIREIDLYYSADGVLIKSIADTDDENSHLPTTQLSAAMKTFLLKRNMQGPESWKSMWKMIKATGIMDLQKLISSISTVTSTAILLKRFCLIKMENGILPHGMCGKTNCLWQ